MDWLIVIGIVAGLFGSVWFLRRQKKVDKPLTPPPYGYLTNPTQEDFLALEKTMRKPVGETIPRGSMVRISQPKMAHQYTEEEIKEQQHYAKKDKEHLEDLRRRKSEEDALTVAAVGLAIDSIWSSGNDHSSSSSWSSSDDSSSGGSDYSSDWSGGGGSGSGGGASGEW